MADPSPPTPSTDAADGRRRLGRSAAVVAAATLTANVLVYGVYLVLTRALTPGDFGAFSALGNLLVIAGVPALALQLVSARHVARDEPDPVSTALRTGLLLGVAGTVLALALSPVVTTVLDLPGPAPAVLVALAVLPLYLAYAAQGCLQGSERFLALGGVLVALAGGRFAAAAVGGAVGLGVTGVLALTALATWAAAALALLLVRPRPGAVLAGLRRTWAVPVLRGATATAALLVATNIDVPLARAVLPPDTAGEYAVLAVFAKAAYWGPAFVATLLYPRMARGTGGRAARVAVVATAAIGLAGVAASAVLAGPLVLVVGGERYTDLASLVPLFVAAGASWSVAQVLVYWRLSRGDHRLGWVVWAVAAGVVASVVLRHPGVEAVVVPVLVGGVVVAGWGSVLLLRHGRGQAGGRRVSARRRARTGPRPR
jgi:O-antigen/teichoic acid export membrane protein